MIDGDDDKTVWTLNGQLTVGEWEINNIDK